MVWYKAAWIPAFFDAMNRVFPNRSKASDGTIGDPAHQGSPSGHNPDDTAGSRPEREDADSKPEVRAADIGTTLRSPSGITMETVIQRILAPQYRAELDRRLIYIIFNHRIWRKANGWRQETYNGSDPHDTHAHLSGDPIGDEDGSPWTAVLSLMEEDVGDFTAADLNAWRMANRLKAVLDNVPTMVDGSVTEPNGLYATLKRMEDKQDAMIVAQTASAVREVAAKAALDAVSAALASADGSVDVAAINEHIDAKVAEITGTVEDLQEQLESERAAKLDLQERLSEAYAAANGPRV